jgi:3D (Asp-Asp-Asp) domain-containing protein
MRKFKRVNNKQFGIWILIFVLVMTMAGINKFKNMKVEKETNVNMTIEPNKYESKQYEIFKPYIIESENPKQQEFIVTAYDLSFASTGKSRGSKGFGITKDGTNLKDKNWNSIRVIAVDPSVIPLGSKVLIKFIDENYEKYDGEYVSRDIGGGVKGSHIDLFLGDFNSPKPNKKVIQFGKTIANVTILD